MSRTTSASAASPGTGAPADTRPASTLTTIGLITVLVGTLLPPLDMFIVNVALPTIDADLGTSESMLELVVSGYGAAFALLLVLGGRLGDLFGRRRLFLTGLAAFTVASLLCGITQSPEQLVAARILQGASGAMMLPQVLATIQATTSGPARARAMGMFAATAGVAASLGQILGGVLVTADLAGSGWRTIFLVNVPIGVVALILAARSVPESKSPQPAGIDISGTVLLGVTVLCLLVPVTEGRALGWPAWSWIMLAIFPVTLTGLVTVSRNTERAGSTPLVPPSLVAVPSMRRGLSIAVLFFAGFGAFLFMYTLLAQSGLGAGPLQAGLGLVPLTATFFAASLITARLTGRWGTNVITAGALVQAVGTITVAGTVWVAWPDLTVSYLTPGMLLLGFGQGLVVSPLLGTTLSEVEPARAGVGGGVFMTAQQLSLALGVAVLGSLFFELTDSGATMGAAFVTVLAIQFAAAVCIALMSRRLPGRAGRPGRHGATSALEISQ